MKDVGNEHVMASDENQVQPPVTRLGFHEIVPGLGVDHAGEKPSYPIDIPEFNLNHQMMAQHRKATAKRRVGPRQKTDEVSEQDRCFDDAARPAPPQPGRPGLIWTHSTIPDINAMVADMVRSDIDRLCRAWAGLPVHD